MADIEWLLDEVENGPEGPEVGAFFDFDGTLIAGYSALAFFRERLKHRQVPIKELVETVYDGIDVERHGRNVAKLIELGIRSQAGQSAEEFEAWSRKVFAKRIAAMVYPDVRVLLQAHRDAGHTIAIASSATLPQIRPTAADLGVDNVLCTQIEVDDRGVITGELRTGICWGKGKANAVSDFAEAHGIDLARSFAYTNGAEDLPLLKLVGIPRPVNPGERLVKIAGRNSWPIARLAAPPKRSPINIARSVAAFAGFGGGVLAGAAMGVLNRDRVLGANVAASVASSIGLAAAGVRLNVVGENNLWARRPAVFIFNHQSQLDVFVLGALLRRDFTGVAKKSLEHDPLFAPIGYLADVAYIDRSNNAAAREALKPVVDALAGGRSIAIAPEGTRSPTERLLPFKKGAFHMAIQAKVPVVPIVIRNCGELMRPHSVIISPGTIDIIVLPPIDTSTWTTKNLDENIRAVRQQYLDTLTHWPNK